MTDEMILGKLERLEHLTLLSAKKVLTIDDVSALTGLSKARLYALCSNREIPYYKQGKLYFKRDDVENWLTAKRYPSQKEIEGKAVAYCHTH